MCVCLWSLEPSVMERTGACGVGIYRSLCLGGIHFTRSGDIVGWDMFAVFRCHLGVYDQKAPIMLAHNFLNMHPILMIFAPLER